MTIELKSIHLSEADMADKIQIVTPLTRLVQIYQIMEVLQDTACINIALLTEEGRDTIKTSY